MAFYSMGLWVLAVWLLFQDNMSTKKLSKDGVYEYKVSTAYCVLLFALPFVILALRTQFGDTGSYFGEYDYLVTENAEYFKAHISKRDHSQLFYGLEFYFKKYIFNDSQWFFGSITLLQAFLTLRGFKKYSVDVGFSTFIFIASAMACQWMGNGVRQYIAVAILFVATDWIINNKWYLYIPLLVFLMGLSPITSRLGLETAPWYLCGIHQSAIIAIPIFFCIQGKPFNKKVWLIVAVFVVLILTGSLDDFLDSSVENTTYTKDLQNVEADAGTNIFRVIVSSIPAVLAFISKRKLDEPDTPEIIKISANASVITSVLYVASAFTSGIYVGRLPAYTELYGYILVPWLVKHNFKENEQMMRMGLIIMYLVYFGYQTLVVWKGFYQSSILGIGV